MSVGVAHHGLLELHTEWTPGWQRLRAGETGCFPSPLVSGGRPPRSASGRVERSWVCALPPGPYPGRAANSFAS
eukprot:2301548-Prymnesium_polylepis.1